MSLGLVHEALRSLALAASLATCCAFQSTPARPKFPTSIAFMKTAHYVGFFTTPRGELRKIWRIDLPFHNVLRAATHELKGWKSKHVLDNHMTFYQNNPKRMVLLFDGALDPNGNPVGATVSKSTGVVSEGL